MMRIRSIIRFAPVICGTQVQLRSIIITVRVRCTKVRFRVQERTVFRLIFSPIYVSGVNCISQTICASIQPLPHYRFPFHYQYYHPFANYSKPNNCNSKHHHRFSSVQFIYAWTLDLAAATGVRFARQHTLGGPS